MITICYSVVPDFSLEYVSCFSTTTTYSTTPPLGGVSECHVTRWLRNGFEPFTSRI